jgi:hypothetical protein
VDDLAATIWIAEKKVLLSVGLMTLTDMAWEWDLLAKIEKQLQLDEEKKWMTADCREEISLDPLCTVKCLQRPSLHSHLTGRQLAQQFLINRSVVPVFCLLFSPVLIRCFVALTPPLCSSRLSHACCRFSATVIALAAIKDACDAKGIKIRYGHSVSPQPFGLRLIGPQRDRSGLEESISEEQISGTIPITVFALPHFIPVMPC